MGWIGAAISAIGSFISKAASVVTSVTALCDFGKKFLTVAQEKIKTGIETVIKVVNSVGKVLCDICSLLMGTKTEDSGELGLKAETSEKKRYDFDTPEEYLKYLDEQELSEEQKKKYEKLSDEEKIGYKAAGISIQAEAVGHNIGIDIPAELLVTVGKLQACGKLKLSTAELIEVIKTLGQSGISLTSVSNYLEGEPCDAIKVGDALEDAVGKIDSIKDPESEVEEARNTVIQYGKEGL